MANETIYGCVDWATGIVKFKFTSISLAHHGCINWTGVHAGQVAVTIDVFGCDDTYYGCVDWATGKFEISVPVECVECEWWDSTGEADCACFGKTPRYYRYEFQGTTYMLEHNPPGDGFPCGWGYLEPDVFSIFLDVRDETASPTMRTASWVTDRTGEPPFSHLFYYIGEPSCQMCGSFTSNQEGLTTKAVWWPCEEASFLPAWTIDTSYAAGQCVINLGFIFRALDYHTSEAWNEPGVGANWQMLWSVSECSDCDFSY